MRALCAVCAVIAQLALTGCAARFEGSNCSSLIAAQFTEQCNPYLSRDP
jgi:hypothetical protein